MRLIIFLLVLLNGTNFLLNAQIKNSTPHLHHEGTCKESARFFGSIRNPLVNVNSSDYDLKYGRFHLDIDPAIYQIKARVDLHFEPVVDQFTKLNFDFASVLTIDSILYKGKKISSFEQSGDFALVLTLPEVVPSYQRDSISIFYHGEPPSGGFGSFIKSEHGGQPILWTLSEPFGSRDWWPCNNGLDDKLDSIDMIISTPSTYKAASNGLLVDEISQNNKTTFHWKHRYSIAPYLVAFAVTNYERYTDQVLLSNGVSMPMINYVYPEHLDGAQKGTSALVQVLQFYDSLFVNYPFYQEKYGHAQFGWGGGMEHQTMSFVVDYSWTLLSHELAHQWFGDMVTCGSWEDIWLNEGFATYLEGISRERFPDKADYDFTTWKTSKLSHITSQPGGSVFVTDTTSVGRIFNGRLSYSKGAYLLHMLRWKLGDEHFFGGIRNYLNDQKFGFARTIDLIHHLETISNTDLGGFFNQWFYGQGYPSYTLTYQRNENNQLSIKLNQTTSHPSVTFFEMPVPVYFSDGAKDTLVRLEHRFDGEVFEVQLNFNPTSIMIDPDLWLISSANKVEEGLVSYVDDNQGIIMVNPNPFQDYLYISGIKGSSQATFKIWDITGKLVAGGSVSHQTIDTRSLEKGMYYVQVQFASGNNIQKLMFK